MVDDIEMHEQANGGDVVMTPVADANGQATEDKKEHDPLTGEFTWRLDNFSELPEKHYSAPFEVGGYQWTVLCFPRGNTKDANAFLSVYLAMSGSDDGMDNQRYASFELSLVNQTDPTKSYVKQAKHTFTPQQNDWGFGQFSSLEDILDPGRGFCIDDTVIIKVKVSVNPFDDYLEQDFRVKTGFVGLKNQGATCYMNSLLQTLYNINQFRKAVYHMPTAEDAEPASSMPLALQSVFYKLQFTRGPVSTKDLTRAFGWDTSEAFQQHDVQELKALLSDRLEEKMKGTRVEGVVNQLFEGHTWNYIDCINIDFKSTRREAFQDLQLDVKGCATIYDSLDKFCEVETLDGDNSYEAEGHGKQAARRGVLFDALPPVLSLHLKRFEYDWQRDAMIKINDRHEFYEELDFDKLGEDEKPLYLSPNTDRSVRNKYKLLAVLVHTGGVHGGHYYAYIRPDGSRWLKFDDETVMEAKTEDVVQDNWGVAEEKPLLSSGFGAPVRTSRQFSNAYMLVYVRESEWDSVMCEVTEEDIGEHVRARLKAEQAEKERRRREKAEAHLYAMVKVATDEDFKKHVGEKRHFDLVDFDADELELSMKILRKEPFSEVQRRVQEHTGVPPERQRFRTWLKRQNDTYRASSPLPIESPTQNISSLLSKVARGRAGPRPGEYAKMDLFLETPPENMRGFLDDKVGKLMFLKQYFPGDKNTPPQLAYAGCVFLGNSTRVGELLPMLRKRAGLPEGTPLRVVEEIKFEPDVMTEVLNPEKTLDDAQLEDGDILVFQKELSEAEAANVTHPTVETFLDWVRNRVTVEFLRLEGGQVADVQEHPPFKLDLLWDMTWDDVSSAVAKHLGLDHSLKVAFTLENRYSKIPTNHPMIYNAALTLERMLGSTTLKSAGIKHTLYYEPIDLPLPEFERLVTRRISFHGANHEELTAVSVRLHRDKTVGELLEAVRSALPESLSEKVGNAPLRLMEVYHWKIWQIFDPQEQVEKNLGPSTSPWHLRAEVIPEDQRELTQEGALHVQCLQVEDKEGNERVAFAFSDPFVMSIGPEETVGQLKARSQRDMRVPDQEFNSWKVVLVSGVTAQTMEPLTDDVVIAQRLNPADLGPNHLYGHRERPCIGFHHENKNPRRTHAHINFNKTAFPGQERALRIK